MATPKRYVVMAYTDPQTRHEFQAKLHGENKKMAPTLLRWIKEYLAGKKV